MPEIASRYVSHGGYKLIYHHFSKDEAVFVLRDIQSDVKDESGRSVPFLLMVVADTQNDILQLARTAAYWSNHLSEVSFKIASLITYDREVNGLKFALAEFNRWIPTVAASFSTIETTKGKVDISASNGNTGVILLSSGLAATDVLDELELGKVSIQVASISIILPLDNKERAEQMVAKARLDKELKKKKRRTRILYIAIGVAVVFTIGIIACYIQKNN